MKVKLYNQNKEEAGQVELPKEIFELKINSDLVHQVVLSQQSNRRQNTASTKGRGEVRGGGKKPWRQKGTGRARHGSIRSPLWRGGGVTFGPTTEKNYKKIIPKKIKRKAVLQVLSAKARENLVLVLDYSLIHLVFWCVHALLWCDRVHQALFLLPDTRALILF